MKKLLILAATTAAISSGSVFADNMLGMENQFYLKAAAGANIMKRAGLKNSEIKHKLKSKTAPVINLAVGYYAMENVRTEIEAGYLFNPKMRKRGTYADGLKYAAHVKPTIWTLMASAYVDIGEFEMMKVFGGVGLGTASVKDKVSIRNYTDTVSASSSATSKRKYNFSYQLTAGVSANVSEGVVAELAYRWQDYGKSKAKKNGRASGVRYKGHNLMAGIRFNI